MDRCAIGHPEPRCRLGGHVDVDDARHPLSGEQSRRNSWLPDQGALNLCASLNSLERIDPHVRSDHALGADRALVADHRPLGDHGVSPHLAALPDHGATDLRTWPEVGVPVDHAELRLTEVLDDHVLAKDCVAPDLSAWVDRAVVADDRRPLDVLQVLDERALAHEDVLAQANARDVELHLLVERVPVCLLILRDVADVLPVLVEDVAVQRGTHSE